MRAVFDIDNTLADTRLRTLAVARQFDQQNRSNHFEKLALQHIELDGFVTALKFGLSSDVARAFHSFWNSDAGFWNGENFIHDELIEEIAGLAHAAEAAGAEVHWLTGRVSSLHGPTRRWFEAHHLPGIDRIMCKPDLSVRTAPFKAQVLADWHRSHGIALFVTEDGRDIAATQSVNASVPCALYDFPIRYRGELLPGTPRLPSSR